MIKWRNFIYALLILVSCCLNNAKNIADLANKCASGDRTACKKLAKIAKKEKDAAIRLAAVKKLMDQEVIFEVAYNDTDSRIRRVAVEKLTDQGKLFKVAKKEKDMYVGEAAVGNLFDESLLAMIAFDNSDLWPAALKKLISKTANTETGGDKLNWRVRQVRELIAAFDKLPTEHRERLIIGVFPAICVLRHPAMISLIGDMVAFQAGWRTTNTQWYSGYSGGIFVEGEIFDFSIKTTKLPGSLSYSWVTNFPPSLSDPLFEGISHRFKTADVRAADLYRPIFEKLTDQRVLAELAMNLDDDKARLSAVEKLTDQASLASVARNDKKSEVRQSAVEKLTDQRVLGDIALKDEIKDVRIGAVLKLIDPAILFETAKNAEESEVRSLAIGRIKNQVILAHIARNHKDEDTRIRAVIEMTDQGILFDLAAKTKNNRVRIAAISKLTDQKNLADIAANDKNPDARIAAVHGLTDQKILAEIAKKDKDWFVRQQAEEALRILRKE